MTSKLQFLLERLREQLWIRPFLYSSLALLAALAGKQLDNVLPIDGDYFVEPETVEKILSLLAAMMLGVATFAVSSMVSAYAAASSAATPRAFALVLKDDISQKTLSTFVAAFIFSIISLIAVKTGYYRPPGVLLIFMATVLVLVWVVVAFVRWTDCIARLGRVGNTIDRVEEATRQALRKRQEAPFLNCKPFADFGAPGDLLSTNEVGYLQHIDFPALQDACSAADANIKILRLPGAFITPDAPIAEIRTNGAKLDELKAICRSAFTIGGDRLFEDDPRFGVVVLSEIAARALSPSLNDPGTAIDIIGTLVRLLTEYTGGEAVEQRAEYSRIFVPALNIHDLFDDGFVAIARDGAGTIEVGIRLQKAFLALSRLGDRDMRAAAILHSARARARALQALVLAEEKAALEELGREIAEA